MGKKRDILKNVIKDPYKKSGHVIINEFFKLWFLKKNFPRHYFTNMLYRRGVENLENYLSAKENSQLLLWSKNIGENSIPKTEDKLKFGSLLEDRNIPAPKIFLFNHGKQFYFKDKEYTIENPDQLIELVQFTFESRKISSLFCKPILGGQGQGVFKINVEDHKKKIRENFGLIISSNYLFQEVVNQHPELTKINPYNLSTLRMVTYKGIDNKVELVAGLVRFGRKGADVDNAHAGGVTVGFDLETGILNKEGSQLIQYGGAIFDKHPDSQEVFEGFQIPKYLEAVALIKNAAKLFDLPLLGWDVAIASQTPLIVEVNESLYLLMSDRLDGGLLKNPKMVELLKLAKLHKPKIVL